MTADRSLLDIVQPRPCPLQVNARDECREEETVDANTYEAMRSRGGKGRQMLGQVRKRMVLSRGIPFAGDLGDEILADPKDHDRRCPSTFVEDFAFLQKTNDRSREVVGRSKKVLDCGG